ncbi:Response regulators consisting of a CheY-like receiver domain and a winged-helix DNA-binding domain [Aquiflexum balticum DSM 16537]|uniref:Response regulators consisting of a CheY-like receiver domain and a winged-helix DNA-binding domain n=1 Tax=Aquiflexum balticum DSM 16537 TaxID=758820 RepID=A0A1W2H1P3_9BACT|nr:response regulator [Aquiflexum balticum]SMD42860.1 Response regulators consisting of a CheY-like receiver domain and a winged-helix DNA-binding domain [Aquiflexum balticum DSM 16537]
MNKILIVDDEPNILLSLEFLFKKEGFRVFIARDGEEAMGIIEENHPELVVLDIMMPKVDGYEVCKYIKEKNREVKVVFLTAKSKQQDVQKGLDLGADLYLTKPFSNKNLVSKVKSLLN